MAFLGFGLTEKLKSRLLSVAKIFKNISLRSIGTTGRIVIFNKFFLLLNFKLIVLGSTRFRQFRALIGRN